MSKRRNDLDIMKDILELCLDRPSGKTVIMYRANLSYRQLQGHLRICEKIGLLKKQIQGSRVVYVTTDKGIQFLEAFNKITSLMVPTPSESKRVKIAEY